jgi:hypothetical protein
MALHWFDPFGSVDIKNLCNVPSVPWGQADGRLIFWDQEPVYRDTAETFFDQFCEIYDGSRTIITSESGSDLDWVCNTYNCNSAYYFFHGWAALDWYRGYDHSFLSTPWIDRELPKRIFCPNNVVGGRRSHRLNLFSSMEQKDLIHNNYISFPKTCPYEHKSVSTLLTEHNLPPTGINLPLIIDCETNHANGSHRIDFWQQAQSCFCHVVTETVYNDSRLHLTEKSFKPIVLQQPFMIVGTPGSLEYLRRYGFRTFDILWDETYDHASDDERIDRVVDNLIKISQWTDAEVKDAQRECQSIVAHNFRWFYTEFQNILWRELTKMIDQWR